MVVRKEYFPRKGFLHGRRCCTKSSFGVAGWRLDSAVVETDLEEALVLEIISFSGDHIPSIMLWQWVLGNIVILGTIRASIRVILYY